MSGTRTRHNDRHMGIDLDHDSQVGWMINGPTYLFGLACSFCWKRVWTVYLHHDDNEILILMEKKMTAVVMLNLLVP